MLSWVDDDDDDNDDASYTGAFTGVEAQPVPTP